MRLDWSERFAVAFGVLALLLASAGVFSVTQDHSVTRYYVGESENSDRGYLVMAERDWFDDDIAFVTDDINKAIDVTNRLNATLGVK